MVLIGGVIVILGFIFFMKFFGLVEKSKKVIKIAKSSAAIIGNDNLDDFQKEIAMKRSSKELFSLFILITVGSIAALVIPFGFIWIMEFAKLLTVNDVIELTLSLEFIGFALIVFIGYFWFVRRRV